MRRKQATESLAGRIGLGLALSGIGLAGYHLFRAVSPRTRTLFGVGLAAGIGLVVWNRRGGGFGGRRGRTGPVTQSTVHSSPADMPMGIPGENLDDRLDEAIHESFPASDPVSVRIE
jgi:hypothetical protein